MRRWLNGAMLVLMAFNAVMAGLDSNWSALCGWVTAFFAWLSIAVMEELVRAQDELLASRQRLAESYERLWRGVR